jgi:hemoglobin
MKRRVIIPALLVLALSGGMLSSCSKSNDPAPQATPSLYERLGGINAVSAVVDQFLVNVVADNRINASFSATVANEYRTTLLRNNLIDQICAGAGGPCVYKGKNMLEAHRGMNITDAQFNALVEDLVAALNTFNVKEKEQQDLLAILGPMKSDIVGR